MSLEKVLKIILCFTSICFVLGRPSSLLEEKAFRFPPSRSNNHPHGLKIPPYMVHLYQMVSGKNKDFQRPEDQILGESDTVQSFSAKNYIVKNNHWSLTFDLSPILRTEELRLVQLRVHFPTFKKSSNVTLAIYCTMNGQGKLLLGSIMTNMPVKQPSFWKTFNITKMMEQYLHLQSENTLANRADRDTRSIDMPEREDASSHSEYTRNMNHVPLHKIATDQAIIVFFTKDTSLSRTMSPGLIKKLSVSSKRMAEFHRKKKTRHNKQQTTPLITNSTLAEEQKPLCRKVDMLVDFKEIGWDNWVVYPKKYNAYQCVGTCHTPLKEKSKTTNYDYIKSFVKLQDSEQVECSACAPLKMRPLSMLFYENKDLILRHHEYMIVEDCGFN